MKLRQAQASDLETLARIEQSGDVHWGVRGLEQALVNSHVLLLLAENKEGDIVGFISALIVADEMQVHNIVVNPEFRRRGIAMMLLEGATTVALSQAVREVLLEVADHNTAAIQLYEKLGFRRSGKRPSFYRDGSDATVMLKSL